MARDRHATTPRRGGKDGLIGRTKPVGPGKQHRRVGGMSSGLSTGQRRRGGGGNTNLYGARATDSGLRGKVPGSIGCV